MTTSNLSQDEITIAAPAQRDSSIVCVRNLAREQGGSGALCCHYLANADDTGASKCVFSLDDTDYSNKGLLSGKMAQTQSAAMLIGSDSVITTQHSNDLSINISSSAKAKDDIKINQHEYRALVGYSVTDITARISFSSWIHSDATCPKLPTQAVPLLASISRQQKMQITPQIPWLTFQICSGPSPSLLLKLKI